MNPISKIMAEMGWVDGAVPSKHGGLVVYQPPTPEEAADSGSSGGGRVTQRVTIMERTDHGYDTRHPSADAAEAALRAFQPTVNVGTDPAGKCLSEASKHGKALFKKLGVSRYSGAPVAWYDTHFEGGGGYLYVKTYLYGYFDGRIGFIEEYPARRLR